MPYARTRRGRRRLAVVASALVVAAAAAPVAAPLAAQVAGGGSRAGSEPPTALVAELRRVRAELVAARRSAERITRRLREEPGVPSPLLDSLVRVRALSAGLEARAGVLTRMLAAAQLGRGEDAAAARPRGWLGVNFEGALVGETSGGPVLVTDGYPRVLTVSPGSPAAAAGLQPGDRLLRIAGRDVQAGPVPLGELLTPGRTVPLRLEREGRRRDVRVRITEAPVRWTAVRVGPDSVRMAVLPDWDSPWSVFTDTVARQTTRVFVRGAGGAGAAGGRQVRAMASARGGAPTPFVLQLEEMAFAFGARLTTTSPALRAALRAREGGVLVLDVAPATPAERAGLRPLDVLTRADGHPLESPAALLRLTSASRDRRLTLELLRDGKAERVELRW